MTLYWIKSLIKFECDKCHENLDTATDDFPTAVAMLRREGWTALPPLDLEHGNWRHRCPKCRFPREDV